MYSIRRPGIAALLSFLLIPHCAFALYETNNSLAAAWLSGRQNPDGSWGGAQAQQVLYTLEAVAALRAVGQHNGAYFKGITWLENRAVDNADYRARRALALAGHGDDVDAAVAALAQQQDPSVTGRRGWGASSAYLQSPLDTAIVLNGLADLPSGADVPAGIDYLKSAQLGGADPGWPVALETSSDPFTTALVVGALAQRQDQDPTLATPIADGLSALSAVVDSGSPAYLQALAAHAAWQAGDTTTAQSWLNALANDQGGNGSWSDQVYTTALVMRAFAAADGTDSAANQSAVSIPDANLRTAINAALGRNGMDRVDRSELLRLTDLVAVGLSIADLTGLECEVVKRKRTPR